MVPWFAREYGVVGRKAVRALTIEEIHWYLMDWVRREVRKTEQKTLAIDALPAGNGYMHPEGFYLEGYDGF